MTAPCVPSTYAATACNGNRSPTRLGYHDDATAYRAVKRVLDRVESESATEYRAVMAARYEQLWRDARSSLDALPADHAGRAALLTSARGVPRLTGTIARHHGGRGHRRHARGPGPRPHRRGDCAWSQTENSGRTRRRNPVLDGIVAEVEAMPDPAD